MAEVYRIVNEEVFPSNRGIYAVGFSMGGNYLLKSAGAPTADGKVLGYKGIATVA